MKKISVIAFALGGLLTFMSCNKNDDNGNHFTFDGTVYPIDSVSLTELVFDNGKPTQKSAFQFIFYSCAPGDTTSLFLGLLDSQSNVLGGNYPAFDQLASETRGIGPFGFYFISAISFQSSDPYLTGEGGSVDVKVSGGNYSLKFNSISVGDYNDLFDTNDDGDSEYLEAGKIGGSFSGTIDKKITVVTKSPLPDANIVK